MSARSDRGRWGAVRLGRARAAGVLLCSLSLLVACNYTDTAKAQELCTQYEQLVDSVDQLLDEDPLAAQAEELRDRAQEVRTQLDEFQAVSEGRFDTALSTVRAEVAAIKDSAAENGTEALDAARPQVEEALENLAEAWAFVQDLADTQCGTGR